MSPTGRRYTIASPIRSSSRKATRGQSAPSAASIARAAARAIPPEDLPRFYDFDTAQISGGHYSWYETEPRRTTVTAKVSHLADQFLGASHDFRFGVQLSNAPSGDAWRDLARKALLGKKPEGETFASETAYDALNRPTSMLAPRPELAKRISRPRTGSLPSPWTSWRCPS